MNTESSQPSDLAIAWAAGLFEGEGCFSAGHRKNGGAMITASLGMTDRDVVERFASIVGCGAIYERQVRREHHKQCFDWRVQRIDQVRDLITTFLPFMGERRKANALRVLALGADIQPHNSQKTHCPKGHPLEGENLILEPYVRKGVRYLARRCQICGRARSRNRMRRIKGVTPDRFRVK